jgi:hypothetical protein
VSIKFYSAALLATVAAAVTVAASVADSQSAFRKLGAIESGALTPGSRVTFTRPEIDGWVRDEAKARVPQGLSNVRVDLAYGRVTGYCDIDFLKLRQAATGNDPNSILNSRLMKSLFAGERPVTITARFTSANGRAKVDVEKVEISGVPIQGAALDFVIANYVRPTFPDIKVNEFFPLQYGIDRFTISQPGVTVYLKSKR